MEVSSHVGNTTVIIAFLLGLVSIGSAIRIWSDPNCQSLVFFEAESTIRRTIPVSCVASGTGADAWALLFFVLGAIPIGYALFLLLDEFGPSTRLSKAKTATPAQAPTSPDAIDFSTPEEMADKLVSAMSPETLERIDQELSKLPTALPTQSYAEWLRERIDNPVESTDNWLIVSHTFPAWSHIHDVSVQYQDAWSITDEKLVMVRASLDEQGMPSLNRESVPEPSSMTISLEGVQNVEALNRATILGITAQFLVDQFYPDGANSPEVAGNKHHKTTRLASTVASIVREINADTEAWGGQDPTVVAIYKTLVMESVPPADIKFFAENY